MKSSLTQNIVSATSGRNILFFSTNPLTTVTEYTTEFDRIQSFSWSCDNKRFSFSGANEVSFACKTDDFLSRFQFAKDSHQCVSKFLRSKSDQIVTSGLSDISFLWQIVDSNFIGLKAFKHPFFNQKPILALNQDDSALAISGKTPTENLLTIFEISRLQSPFKSFKLDYNETTSFLEFCPFTPHRIAISTTKGSLIIQDLKNTSPLFTLNNKQEIPIVGMEFCPVNKDEIYLGYSNNLINIYDLAQRKTVNSINIENKISCFSVFENGVYILVGTSLGKVYQYDNRNTDKPVDVLQLGKNQIDMIDIQNGDTKVVPDIRKSAIKSQKSSRTSLFSKIKRSSKESTITSSISRANQSMKDIKNMFMSPAIKKSKTEDHENENSINLPKSIFTDDSFEKSRQIDKKTIIKTPSLQSEVHNISETISIQDDSLSKKTNSENIDFLFEDLMYEMNRGFREITLNNIKQNLLLKNELKKYISKTIEDSFYREQELIVENNRLREEITHYKSIINGTKNLNQQ